MRGLALTMCGGLLLATGWWAALADAELFEEMAEAAAAEAADAVAEAGDNAAAPDAEDDNAGAAARALQLRVVPYYISVQRSVNFDENGKVNNKSESMSLNFRAYLNGDDLPIGYRSAQLIEAVTSAGETLKPDPNRHHSTTSNQINNRNNGNKNQPSFNFGIQMPAPSLPALSIREVTGKVILEFPDGDVRAIRLSPLSDYLGKPFRVLDMDNTVFQVKRNNQRGNQPVIDLSHERKLRPLIKSVTFYDAKGVPIASQENGWSSNNNMMDRHMLANVPDDGSVLIQLYRAMRDVEQTFVIENIEMPGPAGNGGGARLALKTQPLDEVVLPQPGGDDDAPALLRIELVE